VAGFSNHLIFYRPVPNGVEVVRILHAARDWLAIIESSGNS
jgi:plasmid stabilization system protein ParE